jgi:DNA-binding IclR family transcriptional regulator
MDDHTVAGRILAVLDAVTAFGRPVTLAEITRGTKIPKPTVRRIAADLVMRRMLRRCADGRFILGSRLVELGMHAAAQHGLREAATPYVQELFARTGEIVWVCVLADADVTLVYSAFGANRADEVRRKGWPFGLNNLAFQATAAGRIVLADRPDLVERRRSRPLPAITPHTTISWPRLTATLDAVRDSGIAIEHQQCLSGYSCVATGLRAPTGSLIGIIGVTGRASTLPVRGLIRPLLNAARDVTHKLSPSPVQVGAGPSKSVVIGET